MRKSVHDSVLWAAILVLGAMSGSAMAMEDPGGGVSPRDVVAAKFAAANRHSVEEVVAFYAPDAVVNASDFCAPRQGRAEVERTYRGIFSFVPDAVVEVQEYLVQGDRVSVRLTVSSASLGFSVPIMNFFTVRDGQITSDEGRFDNGGRPCTP
ncbi:nuclear transport factor 2 family protein [Brevundimonas sp. BR2-1]|uniref:nuclear transport factor 2 family protein n=1 Tax=Brevundimonas sp. BR2-1 TaxID=3031123 RepID=UPI0030A41BF2